MCNDIEFLYDIVHMHSLLLQQHKTSVPLHHLIYLHMTLFIMLNLFLHYRSISMYKQ